MQIEIALLIVFGIWLSVLTFLLYLYINFFNRLTKGANGGNLKKVLDIILDNQQKYREEIVKIGKDVEVLGKEGVYHFQKMGLVRFNPFKEMGGDHSFSLAIIDKEENGMIITSLHTRERTRIYMKLVRGGRSDHELSQEEKEALDKARNNKI